MVSRKDSPTFRRKTRAITIKERLELW